MGLFKWVKNHINVKAEIPLGLVKLEIAPQNTKVEMIDVIESPLAACEGERISPSLKVRLIDADGYPVKSKSVRLEFYDNDGLMSTRLISGSLSKPSDGDGIVVFDDLSVKKTGNVNILICVDGIEVTSESIQILPPGLEVDFWNEYVGSPEYEKKFDRAIQFSNND